MTASRKTILYVDDEEVNLFIFQKMFESQFNILTASSGAAALALLRSGSASVQVIISDMRMPGMDGIEFIRIVRKEFPELICYVLTAFSYNREVEIALQDNIIRKAFTKPLDLLAISTEVTGDRSGS